jgi:hypothetical protein
VAGCTFGSGEIPEWPGGWDAASAGPISLAMPPGFVIVDPAGLQDLGPVGEGFGDAVFLARRGGISSPPVDLVVVKSLGWGVDSAEAADGFAEQLQRLSEAPVEVAEVDLPAGHAWRIAAAVPVPLPDVDHPGVNAVVHWFLDADGVPVYLTVSRLGVTAGAGWSLRPRRPEMPASWTCPVLCQFESRVLRTQPSSPS